MRTRILAAAAVITIATAFSAAPSALSAQSTVGVSVTILPQEDANASPVVVQMTAAGLQAQHAAVDPGSGILRSVQLSGVVDGEAAANRAVVEGYRGGERQPDRAVALVQVIAANS